MLVVAIILTLLFSIIDSEIIERYGKINHLIATVFRISIHIICYLLMQFDWSYLPIAFLVHVALFDSFLNLCMGWDWDFIGSTSKWDKFWKNKKTYLYLTKGLALSLAIILQILNI